MRSQFVADFLRRLARDLPDCFIHIHKVKGRFVRAVDSDMAKQQKPPEAYDGYVKEDLVLIRPEAWVKRCAGADHVEIARHLHARGVLLANEKDGKFSKTVQTIGRSERFYVMRRTALVPPDTSDTPDPENEAMKNPEKERGETVRSRPQKNQSQSLVSELSEVSRTLSKRSEQ